MTLHLSAADDPPRVDLLARFFALAWRGFVDHQGWEGPDLENAIEASGLGEWREAKEAGSNYEVGDMILHLTDAGRAAIEAVRR